MGCVSKPGKSLTISRGEKTEPKKARERVQASLWEAFSHHDKKVIETGRLTFKYIHFFLSVMFSYPKSSRTA